MTIALDRDTAPFTMPRRRLLPVAAFAGYVALLVAAWWALSHWVPDQLTLPLPHHPVTLKNVHDKVLGNAALVLLILPSALWLEWLVVGWEKSSARALLSPSQSVKTDLALFILDQLHVLGLIGRILMLGASVISGLMLRDWLAAKTGFAIHSGLLSLPLQVLVYFYVYSFFDYWAHRLGHTPIFWPLHRYHHSAEEFCIINAARIHPAGFAGIFFINIPMPLLGATPQAMVWVNVVTVALGFVIHSRIESGFGWIGRHVIQSPLHHRLHHKLDMREATGFFGMTPIWDHLFGGWSERQNTKENANIAIGVDTHYAQGFFILRDMLRDYRDFWLGLIGKRRYSPSER